MRKLSILFAVLIFSASASAQAKYRTYSNARFGYSIAYPHGLLRMQPPPFNGDGRIFYSSGKSAEMRVWGEFNALFRTLDEEYEEALKDHGGSVTYKVRLKNGFVISGIRNDKIFYRKTLFHRFKETEVFYTFTIEYKKADRKRFDPIVVKIAESFRFDPNADV